MACEAYTWHVLWLNLLEEGLTLIALSVSSCTPLDRVTEQPREAIQLDTSIDSQDAMKGVLPCLVHNPQAGLKHTLGCLTISSPDFKMSQLSSRPKTRPLLPIEKPRGAENLAPIWSNLTKNKPKAVKSTKIFCIYFLKVGEFSKKKQPKTLKSSRGKNTGVNASLEACRLMLTNATPE